MKFVQILNQWHKRIVLPLPPPPFGNVLASFQLLFLSNEMYVKIYYLKYAATFIFLDKKI